MLNTSNKTLSRIGFWSAILTAAFSIAYIIPQLIFMFFVTPSAKHVELTWLMAPSLLLAPSFVVLMVSIHYLIHEEKRIWSLIGLAFSIIYAVLVSITYYVQLGVAVPYMIEGRSDEIAVLVFEHGSFLFAIGILGYGFQSLATLFVAFAFNHGKLEKWIRWLFIINGFLVLPVTLQIFLPELVYLAGLWAVTFIVPAILLAIVFKRINNPN